MNDEREGVPSGSSFARLRLCAGSWNLEKHLPDVSSEDAKEGTLLHVVFATGDGKDNLEEEQVHAAETCEELFGEAIEAVGLSGKYPLEIIEKRYWLSHPESFEPILSGQLDRALIDDTGKALVFDAKFGRGDVQPAEENDQLMAYGSLFYENHRDMIKEVYVAIGRPRAPRKERLTIARYSVDSLKRAYNEILATLERNNNPNAIRTPGIVQCKYCKACGVACPESLTVLHKFAVVNEEEINDPATLGAALKRGKLAAIVEKGIERKVRDLLAQDPESVPGWMVTPENKMRVIADVKALIARACEHPDVTPDKLLAIAKFSLTSIDKLLGGKKNAEEILGDAIGYKPKAGSLKQV